MASSLLGMGARGLVLAAFLLLLQALLADDFTLHYVAQHSHSALAWGLKLAAAWGDTKVRCCYGCCVWLAGMHYSPGALADRRRRRVTIPWG
ncbi:hypothetical protein NMD97_03175 [Edwardsiella tarda]